MNSETPNGASGRIAHRVAAAEEEGERRGETAMNRGKGKVAAINSKSKKPARKSVYEVVGAHTKASHPPAEELMAAFRDTDLYDDGDVPKALCAVNFLINFSLVANGEEHIEGHLANGLGEIVLICARRVTDLLDEHEELISLAKELENEVNATS